LAYTVANDNSFNAAWWVLNVAPRLAERRPKEMTRFSTLWQVRTQLTVLLPDIVANPFHPITLNPSWLTPTVKALAQSIYTDHNFTDLPILADALEEAGCNNEDILSHCRGPGEHTRGCWALDLLLGKS